MEEQQAFEGFCRECWEPASVVAREVVFAEDGLFVTYLCAPHAGLIAGRFPNLVDYTVFSNATL